MAAWEREACWPRTFKLDSYIKEETYKSMILSHCILGLLLREVCFTLIQMGHAIY